VKRTGKTNLYERIRQILESARTGVSRTVNTTQVISNWLIGREIVEEEQCGQKRAEYGATLARNVSDRLQKEYGAGYSYPNLKLMRQFYLTYSDLLNGKQIGYAVRSQSDVTGLSILRTLRGKSDASSRKSESNGSRHISRFIIRGHPDTH
jgi:hypothetical protein